MKISKLLLINCFSKSPATDFFSVLIRKNNILITFVTPNLILFENEIDIEENNKLENISKDPIYLNFSDFYSFINLSEEEFINIEIFPQYINLISGKTKIQLSFLQKPEIDYKINFVEDKRIEIPLPVFLEHVNAHQKIIRKAPEIYDSLILMLSEEEIHFQSTDVYRILSTKFTNFFINSEKKQLVSFPKNVISFFIKSLKSFILEKNLIIKKDAKLSNYLCIDLDDKTRIFFFEGRKSFSNFDDIKNRFSYTNYIEVNKKSFSNSLKEVEIISKTNMNIKYFSSLNISEENIEIYSSNEKNNIFSHIDLIEKNIEKELRINLNTNTTNEIIKAFPDENIRLFFQDAESPLLIRGESGYEAIVSVLSET